MSGKSAVRVLVDVHCQWRDHPPRYRAYVQDELFTERTWIWRDSYLREALTIVAPPGKYLIRYEVVEGDEGFLCLENWQVEHGPGLITQGWLEIYA